MHLPIGKAFNNAPPGNDGACSQNSKVTQHVYDALGPFGKKGYQQINADMFSLYSAPCHTKETGADHGYLDKFRITGYRSIEKSPQHDISHGKEHHSHQGTDGYDAQQPAQ